MEYILLLGLGLALIAASVPGLRGRDRKSVV